MSNPRSHPRLRVLIVEDSEDDALLMVRELKRGGYEPVYARVETAEAMRMALARNRWDLILSDFSLPQFNGREALEILKGSGDDIPFLMVSGTIGEEAAVEAMRAGAHDYLLKGNLKRLGAAVEREVREAKRRGEQRLLEARVRLLEKREAAGKLADEVARDLNDILTAVMACNELAKEHLGSGRNGKGAQKYLDEIGEAVKRGIRLTSRLLAVTRGQAEEGTS